MLARQLIVAGLSGLVVLGPVDIARAQTSDTAPPPVNQGGGNTDAPDPDPTTGFDVNGPDSDGTIGAGVSNPDSSGTPEPPGPATYEPACTWQPANQTGQVLDIGSDGEQITNDEGELGWIQQCPGQPPVIVFANPAVDPVDLIPGASDRTRTRIPAPVPIINPPAEVGGFVNLGLWHAIEQPESVSARATLGAAWAEVTATFTQLSINPGDGSAPFTCEGIGTPYVDGSDDAEQGPCGNTYTQSSPDNAPYQMTYSLTYDITWQTSDGRSGTLASFDRTLTFDYDVDEIQTVGTG